GPVDVAKGRSSTDRTSLPHLVRNTHVASAVRLCLWVGVSYLIALASSQTYADQQDFRVATLWLPNAVVACSILRSDGLARSFLPVFQAVTIFAALRQAVSGATSTWAALVALVDALEAGLATLPFLIFVGGSFRVNERRHLALFALGTVIAVSAGSIARSMVNVSVVLGESTTAGEAWGASFWSWVLVDWSADIAGTLLIDLVLLSSPVTISDFLRWCGNPSIKVDRNTLNFILILLLTAAMPFIVRTFLSGLGAMMLAAYLSLPVVAWATLARGLIGGSVTALVATVLNLLANYWAQPSAAFDAADAFATGPVIPLHLHAIAAVLACTLAVLAEERRLAGLQTAKTATDGARLVEELGEAVRLERSRSIAKSRFLAFVAGEITDTFARLASGGAVGGDGPGAAVTDTSARAPAADGMSIFSEATSDVGHREGLTLSSWAAYVVAMASEIVDYEQVDRAPRESGNEEARVDDPIYRPVAVDLHRLIQDSLLFAKETFELHDVHFTYHISGTVPAYAYVDPSRFQSAAFDLMSAPGTSIIVAVTCTEGAPMPENHTAERSPPKPTALTQNFELTFTVTDTGPGLAPDQLQSLFIPYLIERPPANRRRIGTGLGLATTDRVVKDIGGRVWAVSHIGAGSTFAFSLPISRDPSKAKEDAGSPDAWATVDNAVKCGYLSFLRGIAFSATAVANGDAASVAYGGRPRLSPAITNTLAVERPATFTQPPSHSHTIDMPAESALSPRSSVAATGISSPQAAPTGVSLYASGSGSWSNLRIATAPQQQQQQGTLTATVAGRAGVVPATPGVIPPSSSFCAGGAGTRGACDADAGSPVTALAVLEEHDVAWTSGLGPTRTAAEGVPVGSARALPDNPKGQQPPVLSARSSLSSSGQSDLQRKGSLSRARTPSPKTSSPVVSRAVPPNGNGLRVLVVDDSAISRQILRRILNVTFPAMVVHEAVDGLEAVTMCQETDYNIIYTDLQMAQMNGDDAAIRIRAMGVLSPIIAVTAQSLSTSGLTLLRKAGITEILYKPVTKERLIATVNSYGTVEDRHLERNVRSSAGSTDTRSIRGNGAVQSSSAKAPVQDTSFVSYPAPGLPRQHSWSDDHDTTTRNPDTCLISHHPTFAPADGSLKPATTSPKHVTIAPTTKAAVAGSSASGMSSRKSSTSRHVHTSMPWVDSHVKKSSSMGLGIQIDASEQEQPGSPVASSPTPARVPILVVDDSSVNRSVLARMLEKVNANHDVVEASNGADALRHFSARKFQLVLMDLEMPGMNGEEAAARIRTIDRTVPIVAVTGNMIRGEAIGTLRQAGILETVMKPLSRQKVTEICRNYLVSGSTAPASGSPALAASLVGTTLRASESSSRGLDAVSNSHGASTDLSGFARRSRSRTEPAKSPLAAAGGADPPPMPSPSKAKKRASYSEGKAPTLPILANTAPQRQARRFSMIDPDLIGKVARSESDAMPTRSAGHGSFIEAASAPAKLPRVALVVDDSSISRDIMAKILQKEGLEVHTAISGADALHKCSNHIFGIIFMDLEMPGMGGQEAAARIRGMGYENPIVAATANVFKGGDIGALQSAGIDEAMTKPLTRKIVAEVLRKYGL
ncbi:hypothetical protein HK101_009869, partial [Irineochytrium annulatum]